MDTCISVNCSMYATTFIVWYVHVDWSSGNGFLWDFIWYKLYTRVAELWKHTIQNFQTWFIGTASARVGCLVNHIQT